MKDFNVSAKSFLAKHNVAVQIDATILEIIVNKITPQKVDVSKLNDVDICDGHRKMLTYQHKSLRHKVCSVSDCDKLGEQKRKRISLETSQIIYKITSQIIPAGSILCVQHRKKFNSNTQTMEETQLLGPVQNTLVTPQSIVVQPGSLVASPNKTDLYSPPLQVLMVSTEHKEKVEINRSSLPRAAVNSNHGFVSPRMIMDPVAGMAVDSTRGVGRVRTVSESGGMGMAARMRTVSEVEEIDERHMLPRARQRTCSESALGVRDREGGTESLNSTPELENDVEIIVSTSKSPCNHLKLKTLSEQEFSAQSVNQLEVPCQILKLNQQSIPVTELQVPTQSLIVTQIVTNNSNVSEFKIPAQVLLVSPILLVSKPESEPTKPSLLPASTGPQQEVAGDVSVWPGAGAHPQVLSLDDLLVVIERTQNCLKLGRRELIGSQLQLLSTNLKISGPSLEISHKVRFIPLYLRCDH